MDIKRGITRLQELPEFQRKIILWTVVVIFGIILLSWRAEEWKTQLEQFQKQEGAVEPPVLQIIKEQFNGQQ
ncbi:hypothetical protein IID24_01225 [Patescibacteria group bacterium]|nr:hypothetical protein [Patescibacteria group bacterium]